ncbi:MAG TPA: RodZ domain-containing protein [Dokdonella sp.]|uniref:RodZ domain-containing protein n=1 Tax=Dokdonella sp. TaxID=2291710 RepID=UPI002D7FC669|nr:RodZ domain-containing protein [Dokdonella sp.]HET9031620.1 RodZ domain-containing protein [Dokdonella sp.]
MSNEGVEHQDLQSCSTDTPNQSDSMADLDASAGNVMEDDPGSIGQRLRAARELRGWSCEEVGAQLKLQARLIRRIEEDDYSGIAHAVYLRGYLTSYARLMDMPQVLAEKVVETHGERAPLVSTGRVSRSRYLVDRYSVSATYLILTALVVGPAVWLATHGGLEQNLARTVMLDGPTETREAPIPGIVEDVSNAAGEKSPAANSVSAQPSANSASALSQGSPAEDAPPIIASMAPFNAMQPAKPAVTTAEDAPIAGKHSLVLTLSQSSWVEVTTASGEKLEYGLLEAGIKRSYSSNGAISVRIGNAQGAEVIADGKRIDLAPFRRANVASLRVFAGSELTSDIDS